MQITKRERVDAAISGQRVDRVPFGVWLHNYLEEYSDEVLAKETVRLFERFDFDFIKPQTRAQCFAEMWGQQIPPPAGRDVRPVVSKFAIQSDADLANIVQLPAGTGTLLEQVNAYRRIRAMAGKDVHVIATIFSPMMIMGMMQKDAKAGALRMQETAPDALEQALSNIAATLTEFMALCIDAGVDGVYYATTTGNVGDVTKEQFDRFQRPFDDQILNVTKHCAMKVLHICGPRIDATLFKDYDANVFSWATTQGNPSLSEIHSLTGRTVMSGAPAKPVIASMQPQELAAHVQRSLEEMRGRSHILGPDCSINSSTSPELMDVIASTVKNYALPA